jgi:hypothetical protein
MTEKELLRALEDWDNNLAYETEDRLKQWLQDNNVSTALLKKLVDKDGNYLQQRLNFILERRLDKE